MKLEKTQTRLPLPLLLNFSFWSPAGGREFRPPPCLHSFKIRQALLHGRPLSSFPFPPAPAAARPSTQTPPGWRSQLQSWRAGSESEKDPGDQLCARRLSSAWSARERFPRAPPLVSIPGTDARLPRTRGSLAAKGRISTAGGERKGSRVGGTPLGSPGNPGLQPPPPQLRGALRQRRRGWSCLPGAGRRWTPRWTAPP